MMQLVNIIGVVASALTAISLLPQLIKIIREKKAQDISMLMLASLFLGLCCWIWYGVLKQDWIIIISNSISVLLNLSIVILTFHYKQ